MPEWVEALLSIGIALLVAWTGLVITLLVAKPNQATISEVVRLLPDLLRLVRRLARDPTLGSGVRIRLGLLLIYLAMPIDLVPDVIPVLGYADDVILVVAVLRSTVRHAGIAAVRAHWPGSDAGFAAVCRIFGLTPPAPTTS